MALVTAVVNGQAQLVDPFSAPLENRISLQLSQWYSVQDITVQRQYDLFSFYYDYQATIRADTKNLPGDVASVTEKMRLANYLATGFLPTAVAITSAGQQAPTAPEPGVIDSVTSLPGKLANALNVTVETAKWLIVAIGIAAVALLYYIVANPGRAARIARG